MDSPKYSNNELTQDRSLRTIARFAKKLFYFALNKEQVHLMQELNEAFLSLMKFKPNLKVELYIRYYVQNHNYFSISQEQTQEIQSIGPIKVMIFKGNAPFQDVTEAGPAGIAINYFEDFAAKTGMQYEYVIANSYQEGIQLMKQGAVDIAACISTDLTSQQLNGFQFTMPYYTGVIIPVYPANAERVNLAQLSFSQNTQNSMKEIQTRRIPGARLENSSLQYYLRKNKLYDNLAIEWADRKDIGYCVGVSDKLPHWIVYIMNQYIGGINLQEQISLLDTFYAQPIKYSLGELLYIYWKVLLYTSVSIILLATVVLLRYYKHKITSAKVVQLEQYDELTGAYNRVHFCKLLEKFIENQRHYSVVAFNIRNFKYINDTYGSQQGDKLLCEIKKVLDNNIEKDEFIGRPSSDIFYLALLDDKTEAIKCRLQSIFQQLRERTEKLLDGYQISFYAGAVSNCTFPVANTAQTNLNCVMIALTHAKKNNDDTELCMYDEKLHEQEQLRQYMEAHMHKALQNQEFVIYLQPKKNLCTGLFDGAEALVRWQTKDRGLLFPDTFIPLFEENGFCKKLDLYMIEQACKILRQWIDEGLSPITIFVNQTKALFVSDDYVEQLKSITNRYQVPPQYIVLEILEGLSFENIDGLNAQIEALGKAGFLVSLDDFGAGYSSLNTLGKLKIRKVKLDRMFLMDVQKGNYESQKDVMESIFAMAKKLGIETVAEGVETLDDETLVSSMGCNFGQGYYYSKPIPVKNYEEEFL